MESRLSVLAGHLAPHHPLPTEASARTAGGLSRSPAAAWGTGAGGVPVPAWAAALLARMASAAAAINSGLAAGPRAGPGADGPPAPGALRVAPEVRAALDAGRPVVALESTILAHGMPWPDNLAAARAVEDAIRAGGAVPATIALLKGVPCIGLNAEELEALARPGAGDHSGVRKVSRRDLAAAMAQGADGATTVSGTMLLAHLAGEHGIRVFVTGGLGGVHRGGHESMDVSADLIELGRTPVMVVCAGAKSILDLPRTLEVLETQGVTVAVYGARDFPAFYARSSGLRAPARVDSPHEAAALLRASARIGLASGIVVAVPIPEAAAAEVGPVETAVVAALAEAEASGVRGAALTPFLLARTNALSGGAALRANVALVLNNARVGAAIAAALARADEGHAGPPTAEAKAEAQAAEGSSSAADAGGHGPGPHGASGGPLS